MRKAATSAAGHSPGSAAETLSAAATLWEAQPHRQLLDGSSAALEELPQHQLPHSNVEGSAAPWIRSRQHGQPDAAAAVTLQEQTAVPPQGLLRSLSSRCTSDISWGVDEHDDEGDILDVLDAASESEGDAGNGTCGGEAAEGESDPMLPAVLEHLRKPTLGMPPGTQHARGSVSSMYSVACQEAGRGKPTMLKRLLLPHGWQAARLRGSSVCGGSRG